LSETKSDVSGSSLTMRIQQFNGVLKEINGYEFFGKGYGWSSDYYTKNGDHPNILGFESILFVILCNFGFLGLFFWIVFYILLFRRIKKYFINIQIVALTYIMLVFYLMYTIGTGDYDYMKYLLLFQVISFLEFKNQFNYVKN
jgi:hypothetical protein